MKRLALQCGVLLAGFLGLLLIGSLIEALTPCPVGTVLALLGCLFGGWRLLEMEEVEGKKKGRCAMGAAHRPDRPERNDQNGNK